MKQSFVVLVVAGVIVVSGGRALALDAPAQAPRPGGSSAAPATKAPAKPAAVPLPADATVATVDLQAVLAQSTLGRAGRDKLNARNTTWNSQIQQVASRLQTLQQALNKDLAAGTSTAADIAQKRQEVTSTQLEVQYKQQQRDAELQSLNDELAADFRAKVLPIIEAIRREKGLQLVIDDSGAQILAARPGLDLTQEVVARLDATVASQNQK